MEKHISRHCPEVKTTVFGKIKDFEEQSHRAPPDAILSHAPVIKKNQYFSATHIQGLRNGQTQESFVLVSMNKPVDMAELATTKIGVLDILGRRGMKNYVNDALGTKVKITRVTKTEDILNLLTFGFVDAIFVSQHSYERFRNDSKLPLVATELGIKKNLIAMAVKERESKELFLNCFNRLDKQTNALLGVDKWQLK